MYEGAAVPTFTVPKYKQTVIIHLDSGVKTEGIIFLEPYPEYMPADKKVTAFLEDRVAFFPFQISATGNTEFINKNNIKIVEAEYTDESDDKSSLELIHIENISALFKDGSEIKGELLAEVPAEKSRLSDCLNLPNKFLSVKVNRKTFYINKSMLQKVVSSGRPKTPPTNQTFV